MIDFEAFLLFTAIFVAGKVASWFVYRTCWDNSLKGRSPKSSRFLTYILRIKLWWVHAPLILLLCLCDWQQIPEIHFLSVLFAWILALAAVFRFGCVDLGHFFLFDRFFALCMAACVYFSPVFGYISVIVSCCLQYNISRWSLGPGYSNLLGFEFIRYSLVILVVCSAFNGLENVLMVGSRDVGAEYVSLLLATILGGQGAYYVKQGLVKAWIGRHWFSWMLENRIECLIVNAYLRGWGACFWTKETIISIATYFSKIRLFVCSSIFLVEILSGFLMIHRSVAMGLLCALTIFHLGVFLLTGLLGYEFIINDLVMVWLLSFHSESFEGVFGLQYVLPTVFCALLGFAWVAFIRKRAIVEYQDTFTVDQSYGSLVDAVDLLMGWWDSPYMRMFTYTIVTKNGDLRRFPVTKMSPYDTAITDIHTHMMFLGSHQKLDPQVAEDRKIVCSGVWGLVIDIEKRDLMYALMDSMKVDLSFLRVKTPPKPWTIRSGNCQPDDAVPLWRFFRGINQYRKYWWFRTVMCWPHFPGEDLATDCNPLTQAEIPVYKFDEPIASVVIHRLKTFYTRRDIILLEHTKVGELIVSELS